MTCLRVPRLLDGLHPLVAVALLLGAQLQGLLSVVTKDDQEVVLRRQKGKQGEVLQTGTEEDTEPGRGLALGMTPHS